MSSVQKEQTFAEISDWKEIENVNCFYFWNKRRQKGQNFQFLKDRFSVMGGPMDVIFGVFSDTYARLLKV